MTIINIMEIMVGVLMIVLAVLAINSKSLIKSVMFLSALSMLSVIGFVLMKAPDVAVTEAVIGSGLVTSLFVFTLLAVRKVGKRSMKNVLAFILSIGLGVLIILSLANNEAFPTYGEADISERVSAVYIDRSVDGNTEEIVFGITRNLESSPANTVTAIVADYRSFDTLGEVTVLFISSLGVALLLGGATRSRIALDFKPNFMLRVGSRALFGIILMTGVYVAMHGHLTPGGGFPGGTMISSSVLLLYLADDQFRAKVKGFKILESLAGTMYVVIGLLGLVVATYFLQNFLETGVLGELFSAGIIPIVYVIIGLKVGSEISGIIDHFLTEEGA